MSPRTGDAFLGVDVGTTCARAAVVDARGALLAFSDRPIRIWREGADRAEHSSDDLWSAVGEACREAVAKSRAPADAVAGIGFDATCSLVLLGDGDRPLPATPGGPADRNVIVWMDHRAVEEADRINGTRHAALRRVGGVISPEMQPPKLLWTKERNPAAWGALRRAFDLADFLAFRASGNDSRSLCTTVCKWLHDGKAWDRDFYETIGLGDLIERGAQGRQVVPLGSDLGAATGEAAAHLGVTTRARVAAGAIDAHAGGLSVVGITPAGRARPESVLAMILGTSSCFLASSNEPLFVPGVWGPYPDAMVPGRFLAEGGQSWSGEAIEFLLRSHPAHRALADAAASERRTVHGVLDGRLARLEEESGHGLTRNLHVIPDLIGNRSPLADPAIRGTVEGLEGDATLDGLARLYAAALEGVAHGARHTVETLAAHGFRIEAIHACGGGTKNARLLQAHADVLGLPLLLPECPEAMALGAAMGAAVASGAYGSYPSAWEAMARAGSRVEPRRGTKPFHDRKHEVFLDLHETQARHRRAMAGAGRATGASR